MSSRPQRSLFQQALSAVVRDPQAPNPDVHYFLEHVLGTLSLGQLKQLLTVAGNPVTRQLIQAAINQIGGVQAQNMTNVVAEIQIYTNAWNAYPALREFWEQKGGFGAFINAARRPWQ